MATVDPLGYTVGDRITSFDRTALGKVNEQIPKHTEGFEVTDLDAESVGAGVFPRTIEVQTNDEDGAKLLALWHGDISIAVGDFVRCRRVKGSPVLIVEGYGQNTPAVTASGVWPGPGEIKIGTTAYGTIAAAVTAVSANETILIGEGTFTCDDQTIPSGVMVVGTPLTTLETTTSAYVMRSTASGTLSIYNLTLNNNRASTQSTCLYAQDGSTVNVYHCKLTSNNGTSTFNTGLDTLNATVNLFDCVVQATGGTTNYGLNTSTSGATVGTVTLYGGSVEGTEQDIFNIGTNSTVRQVGQRLTTGLVSSTGLIAGQPSDTLANSGWVVNSSGATAVVGDVGYLDSAGEYQTTTTANLGNVSWCVVTVGGANGARIGVARSGKLIVNYTGTAPSKGHYLTTSTTAGKAQRSTTMRPEIFAIATAAGASNKVEALLLCNTVHVPVYSTQRVITISAHSGTIFSALINGTPSGAVITYDTLTGNGNSIVPVSTAYIGKLRLYNSTQSQYALISTSNGTSTITVTNSADISGWANNDAIQVNSPTVTDTSLGENHFEIKITSELPAHTRGIWMNLATADNSTGSPTITRIHPLEAYNDAKRIDRALNVASISMSWVVYTTLVDGVFTFVGSANGSATKTENFSSLLAAEVAAP